jgi:hypothetical protein
MICIKMDNEIETKGENLKIVTTAELDYNAHLQTLMEFEDLYEKMYITEDNKCGRWILK